jgi:hypothetical protein
LDGGYGSRYRRGGRDSGVQRLVLDLRLKVCDVCGVSLARFSGICRTQTAWQSRDLYRLPGDNQNCVLNRHAPTILISQYDHFDVLRLVCRAVDKPESAWGVRAYAPEHTSHGGREVEMYGTHPYLDPFAVLGLGEQADAARSARDAAATLGHEYVNQRLLDAVRWGASERAQADLAQGLAQEAAALRQHQMRQQMEAAAARAAEERAREARAARRRESAEALLLLEP